MSEPAILVTGATGKIGSASAVGEALGLMRQGPQPQGAGECHLECGVLSH